MLQVADLTADRIISMTDDEMELIPDAIWEQVPDAIWEQVKVKRSQLESDKFIEDYVRDQISILKDASLMDKRYRNCNFDNCEHDNPDFNNAFDRCKKYCINASTILQKNLGIYIYGDVGVGKTHLIACMANHLMESNYTVLFTNISSLIKRITSTFKDDSKESEEDIIKSLKLVDFLFIDDIGAEQFDSQFAKSKIYDLINLRYSIRKPVVFTSNLSIFDLLHNGYELKTIDRINELSSVKLKITGKSRRLKKQDVIDF